MKPCKLLITMIIITLYSNLIAHLQELPLLISVCAYNAGPWIEKNLDSILSQQYNNFHIIYVDDASEDDTALKVQQYIDTHGLQDRITLIINKARQRKMYNIYNVFHNCPDNAIIVQVDGDDWLAHDQVFSHINRIYQENNIWLTYGQFQIYPSNELGYCKQVPDDIVENRAYREYKWVYTHLRTFYAWLFKLIKLQDFIAEDVPGYNGKFFPVCNDNASYFPMLEMCGNKFAFIPDILYIHNRHNPNYGRLIELDLYMHARTDIRSRSKYPLIEQPIVNRLASLQKAQAESIILSSDNAQELKRLLESLEKHIEGLAHINILYQATTPAMMQAYTALEKKHASYNFIMLNNESAHDALLSLLLGTHQDHVLLALDNVYLTQHINLTACILELERTHAYGFYFNFDPIKNPFYFTSIQKENIPSQQINTELYAWKFNCGKYALYNNIDMTLFRKQDLIARLQTLPPHKEKTITAFLNAWHTYTQIDGEMVGLLYKTSKLRGKRTSITARAEKRPVRFYTATFTDHELLFHTLARLKTDARSPKGHAHYHTSNISWLHDTATIYNPDARQIKSLFLN